MNKKTVGLILTISAVAMLTVAAIAAVTVVYEMPMQIHIVPETPQAQTYVDGATWANGTQIQWPEANPGKTYTKQLDIYNPGSAAFTVTYALEGLPYGWDFSYDKNNMQCAAGGWLNGTLSLTVAASAAPYSDYSWKVWVNVAA